MMQCLSRSQWEGIEPSSSLHQALQKRASTGIEPKKCRPDSETAMSGTRTHDLFENCPKQYVVLQLNRGDRINGRGLDLNMTMKKFPTQSPSGVGLSTIMQRVWCETAKVINLQDGRLSCVYA